MNPLLNAMQGAGMMGGGPNTSMMQTVSGIMNMAKGKDPDAIVRMMEQKNPQFAQFMQQNRGKTPQQVAAEYGLDFNQIMSMMG